MFITKFIILLALTFVCFCCNNYADADPLNRAAGAPASSTAEDLNTCEGQLTKYRKFLLQSILSFEDVCDAYNAPRGLIPADGLYRDSGLDMGTSLFFHNYQPPEQRSEIWTFFKLLMAQFNDIEFSNIIRDAIIERCRIKSQLQRDEKRNSVVLGKKQRFHSWGGKRATFGGLGAEEHSGDHTYFI